jgi:hypothetical protein
LLLSFVAGNAISLLHGAEQLIPLTFDLIEVVVRQFAPLFLNLAAELFPLTFGDIPVHDFAPFAE